MRHTAITALVQAGVDLPTIQEISGHKTITMVLRYAHVHGQHIDRGIKVIAERCRTFRRTKMAARLQRNYTQAPTESGHQIPQKTENEICEEELRSLEAGSGIEPLYEDLQSSA
jgi:hypothetical protein